MRPCQYFRFLSHRIFLVALVTFFVVPPPIFLSLCCLSCHACCSLVVLPPLLLRRLLFCRVSSLIASLLSHLLPLLSSLSHRTTASSLVGLLYLSLHLLSLCATSLVVYLLSSHRHLSHQASSLAGSRLLPSSHLLLHPLSCCILSVITPAGCYIVASIPMPPLLLSCLLCCCISMYMLPPLLLLGGSLGIVGEHKEKAGSHLFLYGTTFKKTGSRPRFSASPDRKGMLTHTKTTTDTPIMDFPSSNIN